VNLQRYYEEAGPDYAAWSSHFNMHFGFFRWGMNPLWREAMLEQMNQEIQHRLHLTDESPARVFDMGCGVGATLRSFARRVPNADLNGITLVPWQLEQGANSTTPARKTAALPQPSATTNKQASRLHPSTPSTRLKAAVTLVARTNPRSFRRRIVSCARAAAS
jgi:hypothetical protein